jgi:hypothetical protein
MEHMHAKWTSDDIANAVTATGKDGQPSLLAKLIEDITATPAGDWNECPLCLDVPTMPIITVCRHVFCSECINGVFQMPTARGVVADADDEDAEVEPLGESIACPVCRHKLVKNNLSNFTAPVPAGKTPPPPQRNPAEAIEAYKKINWEEIPDDSDDESLPDLQTIFTKAVVKNPEPKVIVAPIVEPVVPVVTVLPDIPDDDEDEDLFEVFRNNPVTRAEDKKPQNAPRDWADLLDRDEKLSSSKLTALCKQLAEWRESNPEDKIIVFSQFTRALDLVEKMCNENGWTSARYQGQMTLEQRESSLRTFEDDDDVSFLLTSLKCGGVGLNLTGTFCSFIV